MHEVNLFDIDVSMGDVVATAEVVAWLAGRGFPRDGAEPSSPGVVSR
jgi:hypothetical protein